MAIVTTDDKHYRDIAEAIRTKFGTTVRYKPEEMAPAVMNLDSYEEYLGEITGFGTLENTSWADIKAVGASGGGENYWAVGDTKSVKVNGTVGALTFSNQIYLFCIAGFNHNEEYEGKGIHFMLAKSVDGRNIVFSDNYVESTGSTAAFRYNLDGTGYAAGWKDSYLRNTICTEFFNVIPEDLQNAISECTKYSDNVGSGAAESRHVSATIEKIFAPAEFEIEGERYLANDYERLYQKQYDFYKAGNTRVRYRLPKEDATTNGYWWSRSCAYNAKGNVRAFYNDTTHYAYSSNFSLGLAPFFKVG